MDVRRLVQPRSWAKIALAVGSTVLSLALVEGVLRLCRWPAEDPVWMTCSQTAFRFAPHLDYRHMSSEFDVEFRTNSLGLRNDEIGPKRGVRVLLLGDSYTCGYGVQRSQTFADLLRAGLHVDLINAGVGGFEIIHQVRYYRTQGRALQPDLVVYALYLNNDLTNNRLWQCMPDGELRRSDGKSPLEEHGTWKLVCLLKRSVPFRRLFHSFGESFEHHAVAMPGWEYLALCADPLDEASRQNYQTAQELLLQLRDEVTAGGAEFLVMSIPLRAVVEEPSPRAYAPDHGSVAYDLLRPVRRMDDFLRQAGIEHVSLAGSLRDDRRRLNAPLYFPLDGHLNAAGHRCVAQRVLPVLHAKVKSLEPAAQAETAVADEESSSE